ncbi:MAG: M48 family metalloprotease [Chloroflexi bacterium]|nr:M48 family metalloprotease [Chloroflexota bacterium]
MFALIRGLTARPARGNLGRRLEHREAPALYELTEAVAARVKTRPVNDIYLTAGPVVAVTEQGSTWEKFNDRGRRCLILGLSALKCLNHSELAAILAHEYGHFSNRDTAGGSLAYQVNTSMQEMAVGLAGAGQLNPVWLFLRVYHRIYLRITLGASRLQELLADRYAALAYGGASLSNGLTNIIRESVVFQVQANHEIGQALQEKRAPHNLWQLPPLAVDDLNKLEDAVKHILNRPTNAYDTHPSPAQRIAAVDQIAEPNDIDADTAPAEDLVPELTVLQKELTADISQKVLAHSRWGRPLALTGVRTGGLPVLQRALLRCCPVAVPQSVRGCSDAQGGSRDRNPEPVQRAG